MTSHYTSRSKLRVLRSSHRKNPFYELPPPTRKPMPVVIKTEFPECADNQTLDSAYNLNEHKIRIKPDPSSPTLLSYNNDIIYNGYWLRNNSKKKSYCESSSSSPEMIFKRLRRNSVEVEKYCNSTKRRRSVKSETLDEEDEEICLISDKPTIHSIKSENNLARNEIGVMEKPGNIRNFRRNFKFNSNTLVTSIKQEPVESNECKARAKRVRSLSDVSSVKTPLITNFKQEPSETIANKVSAQNSEIGLNFKYVSDISCDEPNSTSIQSPTILTCNNQLTPVNKSKKYRDFKKKLDFGQDTTTSSDFTKIEYDEENIRTLDNTKNEMINRLELNSSKENSFMIEIKSSDFYDKNLENISTSPEVICIGEPDRSKKVTEVTIDDHSADKTNYPILLCDEYNTENSNLSIVFTAPAEENKTNTYDEKGFEILAISRGLQDNSEFLNIDNIEPSINCHLDSKMLSFLLNDSSQDSPPLNLKNFRTPGNPTNRDSVVPNSDESLCSSPEESILEMDNFSKFNQQNQKGYADTKVIGISSNFLASEINNNYSESPIDDMSIKYNKFSKKMDNILFELAEEKLLPLVNQKSNYYNLEFPFSREQELEIDLINEIIEEDLAKEKVFIYDETESANIFENSRKDCLKFNEIIQCSDKPGNDESANLLPTTVGPEVSSASNPLDRKISHEEFINNKNEVSETGNINNEECLEIINNDGKGNYQMLNPKNSIGTNFCEKDLRNSYETSEIDRTISNKLQGTDNKTMGTVRLEQTILYTDSTFPESKMVIVEHATKDTKTINTEENNCPADTISMTGNTSAFFCEEILDNSNDLLEPKNSYPRTSTYSSKEPKLVSTECTIICTELGVSKNFPLEDKTNETQFDYSSVVTDRNKPQIYNIDQKIKATNDSFFRDNEEVQAPISRTTEQSKINRDLFENAKMSNFEHESFATAFACSLQSLYQFDRECVSPIILSKNISTESETSDEFVLTTIGDYVSPIPSDIEESFYLSPTIRELDMKPYAKYFDTEKIKNAEDPELEFSKQLGKCKAIGDAITLDYRKRQRLGEIPPDARWQASIVKRLRAQQRKFDRDLKRRKDSKKRKSEDKNSNFVEVKSSKSKAIALKKTDLIFKNQKLSSIPSTCSSIRIGENPKEITPLVPNVDKIIGKRSGVCEKIKESGDSSSLVELQCELNGNSSENTCDSRNRNLKVPFQKTEVRQPMETSNSEKVEASCTKRVPISSNVFPDTKPVLKVPNKKTDIKSCTKKSISTFKIPFKRPPCTLVSSEEKKTFVPKTDKPKKYAPPYSLLKKSVDKKPENRNLETITREDKMQKCSQKWIELKKEIKKRNPNINIDGAISLLGKTEIAKRNAAFEAMAKTVESQMKALKSAELTDRIPKTGTISQPSVKDEEMKNIPNVLNMVNILNKGRNFIGGDTKTTCNQSWSEHLNKTVEQETKVLVQPTHDINTSKLLLTLLSTRKDLLWQNCSVLLRYGDWSGNCEAKKTMMDAMSTIPVDSAAILNSVATIKSIFKSSRSENKRVAEAANTLLLKMGTVEEILPFLFMNN